MRRRSISLFLPHCHPCSTNHHHSSAHHHSFTTTSRISTRISSSASQHTTTRRHSSKRTATSYPSSSRFTTTSHSSSCRYTSTGHSSTRRITTTSHSPSRCSSTCSSCFPPCSSPGSFSDSQCDSICCPITSNFKPTGTSHRSSFSVPRHRSITGAVSYRRERCREDGIYGREHCFWMGSCLLTTLEVDILMVSGWVLYILQESTPWLRAFALYSE